MIVTLQEIFWYSVCRDSRDGTVQIIERDGHSYMVYPTVAKMAHLITTAIRQLGMSIMFRDMHMSANAFGPMPTFHPLYVHLGDDNRLCAHPLGSSIPIDVRIRALCESFPASKIVFLGDDGLNDHYRGKIDEMMGFLLSPEPAA